MKYFDGIQVGQIIYHWDIPIRVSRIGFGDSKEYFIAGSDTIHLSGTSAGMLDQVYFWQPVPKPIAPPRPKRKVTKYLELYKMHNEKEWHINKHFNGFQVILDRIPSRGEKDYSPHSINAYAPIEVEE